MYYRHSLSDDLNLFLSLNLAGVGVTGASPEVAIRRTRESNGGAALDNFYFDGAGGFTSSVTWLAMSEFDATNNPGLYNFFFDQSAVGLKYVYTMYYRNTAAPLIGYAIEEHIIDPTTASQVWDAPGSSHVIAASFGEIVQTTSGVVGTAANAPADSYVLTTGVESANSFTDTRVVDGVEHQHTDVGNAMELYYEFSIGGDGIPTGVVFTGRLNSANDSLGVFAWNWGASQWDQIGTLVGKGGSSNDQLTYSLFTSHVGVGADLGTVRIQFETPAGLSSATLYVDQILTSFIIANRSVGYAGGAIWVDTNASNTNTEPFVDGVADNPVSTWDAAMTINALLGLNRFQIAQNSSIVFTGPTDNYEFLGIDYMIDFNGQQIAGTTIRGALLMGESVPNSGSLLIIDCALGVTTLRSNLAAIDIAIAGPITLRDAGDYFINNGRSRIPGTGAPVLDFGGVGAKTVSLRAYSGGIEVQNMKAGDVMSMEGNGQLIINANCTGGIIAARGNLDKTDNSGGAVTLSEVARVTVETIDTELTRTHLSGSWQSSVQAGTRTITITVEDQFSNPVPGVVVDIYDASDVVFLRRASDNDLDGIVSVNLDDGTYSVRIANSNFQADNIPETLVVTADAAVTYSGTTAGIIPPPSAPNFCVVFGTLRDVNGVVHADSCIDFYATTPQAVPTVQLTSRIKQVITDENGFFTVELERTARISMQAPDAGIDALKDVPDAVSQDLSTWADVT